MNCVELWINSGEDRAMGDDARDKSVEQLTRDTFDRKGCHSIIFGVEADDRMGVPDEDAWDVHRMKPVVCQGSGPEVWSGECTDSLVSIRILKGNCWRVVPSHWMMNTVVPGDDRLDFVSRQGASCARCARNTMRRGRGVGLQIIHSVLHFGPNDCARHHY